MYLNNPFLGNEDLKFHESDNEYVDKMFKKEGLSVIDFEYVVQ